MWPSSAGWYLANSSLSCSMEISSVSHRWHLQWSYLVIISSPSFLPSLPPSPIPIWRSPPSHRAGSISGSYLSFPSSSHPLSSLNSSIMFLLTFHHPTWSHLVAGGRPELQPLDPRKEVQRVFPTPPADGPGTPARHNSTELLQMILLVYSAEFQPIRGPHLTLHRK